MPRPAAPSGVCVLGSIPHRYPALPMSSSTGSKQSASLNKMFLDWTCGGVACGCYYMYVRCPVGPQGAR